MNIINIESFLIFILFITSFEADTDCLPDSGKKGKECGVKSTYINVAQWNFIAEDDLAYMCCYYKGKIGNDDYEGCYAFYEDDIKDYHVNDLLHEMERGEWENALGVKYSEPSIDCLGQRIKVYKSILIFILIILII